MKPSQSEFVQIRGLRYHCRCWGEALAPKLFMLHGWMDVSASFQFLVDALRGNWRVIAPDWRGFGLSEWAKSDRSEEHTSELQSPDHLVCRLLLEKKKTETYKLHDTR